MIAKRRPAARRGLKKPPPQKNACPLKENQLIILKIFCPLVNNFAFPLSIFLWLRVGPTQTRQKNLSRFVFETKFRFANDLFCFVVVLKKTCGFENVLFCFVVVLKKKRFRKHFVLFLFCFGNKRFVSETNLLFFVSKTKFYYKQYSQGTVKNT